MAFNIVKNEQNKLDPTAIALIGIAVIIVIVGLIIGFTRNKNTSSQSATTPATTTTSGLTPVDQNAWDALASQQANQAIQLQTISTTQTGIATAQTQQLAKLEQQMTLLQQQGADTSAIKTQIDAIKAQLNTTNTGGGNTSTTPPSTNHNKTVVVEKWPAQKSTLWGIAQAEYGNGALWPKIASANPWITNPNVLQPGWVLQIPAA